MKVVITIIGKDQIGIVARASTTMAENHVNILDINQNIMNGYFNMVMVADMEKAKVSLKDFQEIMKDLGGSIGVEIKVQHEEIFNVMHRI